METLDYLKLDKGRIEPVVSSLARLLADFQVYYTNLRGFHWNVSGSEFFLLHEKFESLYDDVETKIDEIAERILMLGGTPENRFSEYLRIADIKEVYGISCGRAAIENVLDTLKVLIGIEREIIRMAAEAGDEGTAGMVGDYLKDQEKTVWMLTAFLKDNCKA